MKAIKTLPQWKCHKVVGAAKIKRIEHFPMGEDVMAEKGFPYARLHFEDTSIPQVVVDIEYMSKNKPQEGGYFVQYENIDGSIWHSWSPAAAFEDGYSKLQ